MRISLNWLKKYVDVKVPNEGLVRLIGARLVEVEEVIDESTKYNNIYIVRVVSSEHIPDTHLSLCKIDVGGLKLNKVEYDENGYVQVMCGAPNVRAGMLAVWIAPGAVVPASVHEDAPFVIGKRKMLGKYDSYGMLAGADELDFGDDHSGIVEIDPANAKPGDALSDIFELNDLILDIENKSLTHRPDCFGIIGFAREVAGILGEHFNYNIENEKHNIEFNKHNIINKNLKIEILEDKICPRYTAVVLEKHGELKKKYLTWQDTILAKSGMRPIDPIVDVTNYLMLLTGQPLHAFDYDKFVAVGGTDKPKIIVRLARAGEELELLDGKKIALNETDIVITSNDVPVALAGAMGGASTEIDETTRNVIIESATFSLYNLRKTQMVHGIFSEAITRFTKGQPAEQTLSVGLKCAEMLSEGFKMSGIADEYPRPEKLDVVKITTAEINGLLGTEYDEKLIVKTLENVGFKVKKGSFLEVTAPAWRTDIAIKEDIIEEIGRLLGYDNIAPVLPRHGTAARNKTWEFKTRTREILSSFGANEVLTYSFVSGKLIEKAGQEPKNSYKIVNSISPELQYVRQSLVPSLLEKAYMNQKIPFDKFALFEINKVYEKAWGLDAEKVPVEKMHVGLVLAERKTTGAAYYKAKNFAEKFLQENNVAVKFVKLKEKNAMSQPFEPVRAAEIRAVDDDALLGVVGEFKNSVRRNFKLAEYAAGFEMDLVEVLNHAQEKTITSDFNTKTKEDITITTADDYAAALRQVEKEHPGAKITPVGIYQPAGAENKNITFHLEN